MAKKTPPETPLRTPKHGHGKLRPGGWTQPGPGRTPDAFKQLCRGFASRDETAQAVDQILKDPTHPAFLGALKWATENGYGKAAQPIVGDADHPVALTVRVVRD